MLKLEQDRNQLQMWSLESLVSADSVVRLIDAFVDALNLEELGFEIKGKIKNGAPAYKSSHLLKLYYYGYLNRVRSSRRLEREALTNVEAMWLLKGQQPGYKTIANFRSTNKKGLKEVFVLLNRFLKSEGLFDEEIIAVDGSKFRGQNSKKNNYNAKKVDQHLKYIEKQTMFYLDQMDDLDKVEEETESEREERLEISKKLDHLEQRKKKYKGLEKEVEESRLNGQAQISTVDKDARALPKRMNIIEVGYNVITSAEQKNKLITNFEVTNELDTYGLSGVSKEARQVLGKAAGEKITVLADKGFDTGSELKVCSENDITTLVSPKKRENTKKEKAFRKGAFIYEEERDEYICPMGERLRTNGTWYKKKSVGYRQPFKFQRYTSPYRVCNECEHKLACAGASKLKYRHGREIERSEYEVYVEENKERVKLNKDLYRKRQSLVEHQFGTIKRQWGYDYTLLKGKEKVTGEFSLIFTCYNLRRVISILGMDELINRIGEAFLLLKLDIRVQIRLYKQILLKKIMYLNIENWWKRPDTVQL